MIKLCKCGCGQEIKQRYHHKYYGTPDYLVGHNNRGKKFIHTKEWNENIGKAQEGRIPWNKGKKTGKQSSDLIKKRVEGRKGYKNTIEHNGKIGQKNKVNTKRLWQNKEYREKQIKSILKGLIKRPTSLEQEMNTIIKKYNLPYKYTGDGRFLIGYKNPDFININGEKICIEVANIFHHSEDYPKQRKEYFAKWGWKCIVFRGDELNEKEVISELISK